jgi:hypothetical protein
MAAIVEEARIAANFSAEVAGTSITAYRSAGAPTRRRWARAARCSPRA